MSIKSQFLAFILSKFILSRVKGLALSIVEVSCLFPPKKACYLHRIYGQICYLTKHLRPDCPQPSHRKIPPWTIRFCPSPRSSPVSVNPAFRYPIPALQKAHKFNQRLHLRVRRPPRSKSPTKQIPIPSLFAQFPGVPPT